MLYRPRHLAVISTPIWGSPGERVKQGDNADVITFPVNVSRANLVKNDHRSADELEIVVDWRDAGVDPRLLSNAIVSYHLGCAEDDGTWEPTRRNRRFLGIVTDPERSADDSERSVTIKAQDFTTLFLESKPYPPEGIPTYSMDLEECWNLILDHTGGKDTAGNWFKSAELLRGALLPSGIESWPPSLSECVGKGNLKDKIQVKPGTDAWAVWQHCVGMLGLISWIDGDNVIVSTSTNLYSRDDPALMVWGHNIRSIRERRNCTLAGKKIALVSYDPMTGRVLHAFAPVAPKDKKGARKQMKSSGDAAGQDAFLTFEFNGVSDQGTLDRIARRVYEERSRQELEGTIITEEMWTDTLKGETVDLLSLGSGQDIYISLDEATMNGLSILSDIGKRTEWLLGRGYERSVAEILARNEGALSKLTPIMHTKSVRTSIETDENGGSFSVEINYVNRIELTGAGAEPLEPAVGETPKKLVIKKAGGQIKAPPRWKGDTWPDGTPRTH